MSSNRRQVSSPEATFNARETHVFACIVPVVRRIRALRPEPKLIGGKDDYASDKRQ